MGVAPSTVVTDVAVKGWDLLLFRAKRLFLSANPPRFKKHSFPLPCQNARLGVSRCTYAARTGMASVTLEHSLETHTPQMGDCLLNGCH